MKKSVRILTLILLLFSFYSCNNEQTAYTKAKQDNSIEALTEFATNYPNGNYIDSAKSIIDSIIWQGVLSKDSMKVYEKFIDNHPRSKYYVTAKGIFDSLMWQEVKSLNTADDYEILIDEYPNSNYIDSAKMMFEKLKPAEGN